MKIKIKNPILGVPITIVDKIADDGFILTENFTENIVARMVKNRDYK